MNTTIPMELVQKSQLNKVELAKLIDHAKWAALLRGYCIITNPLCIYSRLHLAGSLKKTYSTRHITIPDDMMNCISNIFDICNRGVAGSLGSWLMSDSSEALIGFARVNKPWRDAKNPYVITQLSPLRLGASLSVHILESVACPWSVSMDYALELTAYVIAWYYNSMSDQDVVPAPLTRDEVDWVLAKCGSCDVPIMEEV